jgi:hypothetical protein
MDHLNVKACSFGKTAAAEFPRSQRELVALSLRLKPAPKDAGRFIERDRRYATPR